MRNDLLTCHHRLLRLEETVRKRKIKLSEEQKIQALERFDLEYGERHIEVHTTGELVAVGTFVAGTLKGVGKVYRPCSAASAATSGPGSTPRSCP